MSRKSIQDAFDSGKVFIPFVTCGDPNLSITAKIVRELERAGAGLIELGIPFSDPTAEGPVIQEANIRSLDAGTTTDDVFELVEKLREGDADNAPVECPLVVMTYANVVFHYRTERFCERAAAVGIDGIILPDVPFEEKDEFARACKEHGLALISMIAPTSEERIGMIASQADGFIYLVSSLGVTGMRSSFNTDLGAIVQQIRKVTDTPVAIGFGISNARQAHDMSQIADGVIVGSAIVKQVAEHGERSPEVIGKYAREIVSAI